MSNHRKLPREKSYKATASNGKLPGGKKDKAPAKKELKQKTVAAEIEGLGLREETSPVASPPRPRQAAAAAKPTEPAKPAPAPAKPVSPPKAVASKPAPAVAKPAPVQPKAAAAVEQRARAVSKPAPKPEAPRQVLGGAVDTFQRSFAAAGQGTLAVNCKLLDFARANVNTSLDYVKDLAAARSPVRVMRLQMEYWQDCLETFVNQAQELRALSAELVANANEPLREHIRGPRRAA